MEIDLGDREPLSQEMQSMGITEGEDPTGGETQGSYTQAGIKRPHSALSPPPGPSSPLTSPPGSSPPQRQPAAHESTDQEMDDVSVAREIFEMAQQSKKQQTKARKSLRSNKRGKP